VPTNPSPHQRETQGAAVRDEVRAAELTAALCLATDLATELPLEHGLHATMVAMRLADRLGVDADTARQAYYGCLLFHAGCTAGVQISGELFDDGALLAHFTPVMFGSRGQTMRGLARALGGDERGTAARILRIARGLPRAVHAYRTNLPAGCEVAEMVGDRLGMPPDIGELFGHLLTRWDGAGDPPGTRGDDIPLAVRIVHVARDAAFQHLLGGPEAAARVVRDRAGGAFDPRVAAAFADDAAELLTLPPDRPAWDVVLAGEPGPVTVLRGPAIDEALAAMGDFADLASPYLVGHSAGVADLVASAARRLGFDEPDVRAIRRSALVHDIGRVAVPVRIWQKPGPLTTDEWERVRLHSYYSERILCRSTFLAGLSSVATAHHERLDGSGYHRGLSGAGLSRPARLLAAADSYHAMTEARPHREPLPPQTAAASLSQDAQAGRLDGDSVAAVLEAAGHRAPRLPRPAGLTEREVEVIALLARGLQTKEIARALGITPKTAGNHVQNAYAKIGISTRAAATMFAMRQGLVP
jgi:HD-GYP domain-containing protein (c-di-GMP phosphodiesterase class II)